jgi:cyclin B
MAVEYIEDISSFIATPEAQFMPEYGYMNNQRDINEKMRAILIDWLIEVHYKFRLKEETLFITCNIIDRYLCKAPVKRQVLQLVGVTAMLIASKYEDIYPPPLHDFVYITDNAYTGKDIIKMEYEILKTLEFNVTTPSSFTFLNRFLKVSKADSVTESLATYLVELPLIEYRMLKYSPILVAASAVYVASHILKKRMNWRDFMADYTGFSESEIRACSKDLCILFHGINKINLQAVKKKFSSSKFHKVGLITLQKLTSSADT